MDLVRKGRNYRFGPEMETTPKPLRYRGEGSIDFSKTPARKPQCSNPMREIQM
jgi:hypothetical protein